MKSCRDQRGIDARRKILQDAAPQRRPIEPRRIALDQRPSIAFGCAAHGRSGQRLKLDRGLSLVGSRIEADAEHGGNSIEEPPCRRRRGRVQAALHHLQCGATAFCFSR